jgi:hypothetical protein
MKEEKPPLLKTWNQLYGLVIGVLLLLIVLLYAFTQYFQ